ncbi:YMR152W [Kluyveromyces marxianus]|uniref:YMR152W n=1 Tax=Kluyveromyces marxianus TaxID=4911 RepID=A0ABX6EUV7_KLUMA|nr:YMR152W [Kluyveromyces marxianus]
MFAFLFIPFFLSLCYPCKVTPHAGSTIEPFYLFSKQFVDSFLRAFLFVIYFSFLSLSAAVGILLFSAERCKVHRKKAKGFSNIKAIQCTQSKRVRAKGS